MESTTVDELRNLKGLVATVVLTGNVMEEYATCLMEARAHCITEGYTNIEWRMFQAQLVEHGRDSVIQHAKDNGYDFALMIDADATFQPDLVQNMLYTAFAAIPEADAVSAYAQLKSEPYLPVIDTGTGTWEPHFPGEGILECIRVGGHCLMVKSSAWHKLQAPWFKTRRTQTPADALAEVDNYARVNFDGDNPFQGEEWSTLMEIATEEHGGVVSSVGEDSGFCDALLAAGGRLFVNCDIVTGHVYKTVTSPTKLKESMEKRQKLLLGSVGVY